MKMDMYLAITFLCALSCALARPDGAPKSACQSLMPKHSGLPPQNSESSYRVSAVTSGGKIRVTISSSVGEKFEGFILQARSSKDRNRIIEGEFTSSRVSKTIDCFRGKRNTLTQVNTNPKAEVITEFTPSNDINEDIVFRATVAKTYAEFWTEIDSASLRVESRGGGSHSGNRKGLHPMYADCYTAKGCFGYPSGCVMQGDCEVLLTYAKSSTGIRFTMYGYLDTNMYMAMAFSTDARMGNDAVTECLRQDSNIIARESWNGEGKSNDNTRNLPRESYQADFTNGLTTCSWMTPFVTEYNGRKYNLADGTYHVLLAKGPVTNGKIGYHSERIASQDAINFTALEEISGEGVSDAVKIHGSTDEITSAATEDAEIYTEIYTENHTDDHTENHSSQLSIDNFLLCLLVFAFWALGETSTGNLTA